MGENTLIPWCDHTFNGWIGCEEVPGRPECGHCYAKRETFVRVQRSRGIELWGRDGHRHVTSEANWRKPFAWNRAAHEAGKRARVFCSSLSDIGENRVDLVQARHRLLEMIEKTDRLDWLLLTKRIDDFVANVPRSWSTGHWPRNVWMGVTAGVQKSFDTEAAKLVKLRGPAVKFVSIEPILEPLKIWPLLFGECDCAPRPFPYEANGNHMSTCAIFRPRPGGINWVIVGGESNQPKLPARRCELEWFFDIVSQCYRSGVARFVKQLGSNCVYRAPGTSALVRFPLRHPQGEDMSEFPEGLRIREFPKASA